MSRPAVPLLFFMLACGSHGGDPPAVDGGTLTDGAGGSDKPAVVLRTSLGDLVVQLEPTHMPRTTANFLAYVDSGFYDATLIHRVVDDWVIQGGGYGPGLEALTPSEPIDLETSPAVSHVHGAISMARTNDPDSATSQWFICDWPAAGPAPQPAQLDGQYAAFGVLIEGFDVLEKLITQVAVESQPPLDDVPVADILVTSARRR